MKPFISSHRPALGVTYSLAADHVRKISDLKDSCVISLVSVSEGLLRTAKSIFAPAIGKKHVLNEVLVSGRVVPGVGESDLVFCDTATIGMVRSRRKVHYKLIAKDCLSDMAATLAAD